MDRNRNIGRRASFGIAFSGLLLAAAETHAQALAGWKYHKDIKINTSASGAAVPGKVDRYPLAVILKAADFDFSRPRTTGPTSGSPSRTARRFPMRSSRGTRPANRPRSG